MPATIVALFLSSASRAPLARVERVHARADHGLEGDRHAGRGQRRSVLFMRLEDLDAFGLAPGDVREQVVVRDLDLYAMPAGARLRAGGALFEIGGPCAPCARMDELQPGLKQRIDGRRGRFARVIESGDVEVGQTAAIEP